jgi:hypothetical protein
LGSADSSTSSHSTSSNSTSSAPRQIPSCHLCPAGKYQPRPAQTFCFVCKLSRGAGADVASTNPDGGGTLHRYCTHYTVPIHCTHYTVLTILYSLYCTHYTVLTILYSLYCTHTLYSYTVLIHCTHTLYSCATLLCYTHALHTSQS